MTRRALLLGINHYDNCPQLRCAINDACRIEPLLARNDDETVNYTVRTITSDTKGEKITRVVLRQLLIDLFHDFDGDVLFYFSGHGVLTAWGGSLATQDACTGDEGVSMDDVLVLANKSRARDVVLILDCCHSGALGDPSILQTLQQPSTLLREGVTILAASRPNELSYEANGYGLFSDALAEGLAGGAADHLGNVSAASLFLYAERMFDAWNQRPIYKSYTARVSTLRTCKPPVDTAVLRLIRQYFPTAEAKITLDPEYEAEENSGEDNPDRAKKRAASRIFKQLRDARMLQSCDGEDLYWAAMNSKDICLTILGRYYWKLIERGTL